jgi:hypothetical protein
MAKLCKHCNKYPVFTHGYCLNHKHLYKKPKPIAKRSAKRVREERKYSSDLKKERDKNCIFCGQPNDETISRHHLWGRDDDLLNNPKYYRDAHYKCHMEDYHGQPYSEFMKMWYYDDFMERLRGIGEEIYNHYKIKEFKVEQQKRLDSF